MKMKFFTSVFGMLQIGFVTIVLIVTIGVMACIISFGIGTVVVKEIIFPIGRMIVEIPTTNPKPYQFLFSLPCDTCCIATCGAFVCIRTTKSIVDASYALKLCLIEYRAFKI